MAKKFVHYELDKIRNIRLGMEALDLIKFKTGKTINKFDFEENLDAREIATVLWAGMIHEDADLTVEKVMKLIDEYSDIMTAIRKMGEAFEESFGKNELGTAEKNTENGIGTQL